MIMDCDFQSSSRKCSRSVFSDGGTRFTLLVPSPIDCGMKKNITSIVHLRLQENPLHMNYITFGRMCICSESQVNMKNRKTMLRSLGWIGLLSYFSYRASVIYENKPVAQQPAQPKLFKYKNVGWPEPDPSYQCQLYLQFARLAADE